MVVLAVVIALMLVACLVAIKMLMDEVEELTSQVEVNKASAELAHKEAIKAIEKMNELVKVANVHKKAIETIWNAQKQLKKEIQDD